MASRTVAYNVANAATNGMVIAYHFGLGTDPRLRDTDGDGLTNADECMWGISPWIIDTDGDGATDGEEE